MKARASKTVSLPLGLTALAAVALLAAAGQGLGSALASAPSLGPVTANGGSGNVGLVASQSLFFAAANPGIGHSGIDGIDQAAASVDTAGLNLQAAFRMHRGDPPSMLDIDIANRGSGRRGAFVQLVRPSLSSVNLFENDGDCQLAQFSTAVSAGTATRTDRYLLVVNTAATCTVRAELQVGTAEPLGSSLVSLSLSEIP